MYSTEVQSLRIGMIAELWGGYFVAGEIRRNWFICAWVLCASVGPVAAADSGERSAYGKYAWRD